MTARFIVADVFDGLATLDTGSGGASRRAELLPALTAVECFDGLRDVGHLSADLRSSHSAAASRAPYLDVGLGYEDAASLADEGDVAQLDRLNARRVMPTSSIARLAEGDERFPSNNIWDDEGLTAWGCVEVAKPKEQVGLASLDSEVGPERFQDRAYGCGVDLPDVDGSSTSSDVSIVDVGVTSEVPGEHFYRLGVELFHRAAGLVGRLFRVGPLARPHLVPVDVNPHVSIGVHHARHVGDISVHSAESDIDQRNEALARDRVGPFLFGTVEVTPK